MTFAAVHTAAARAQSLLDQSRWMFEAELRLEELDLQIGRLQQCRPDRGQSACDVATDAAGAGATRTWQSLMPHAQTLRSAGQRLRRARAECECCGETLPVGPVDLAIVTAPPEDTRDPVHEHPVHEPPGQAARRRDVLSRRALLEEHTRQMQTNRRTLQRECQLLLRRQMLPMWALGLLGVLFTLGLASCCRDLFHQQPLQPASDHRRCVEVAPGTDWQHDLPGRRPREAQFHSLGQRPAVGLAASTAGARRSAWTKRGTNWLS